MFTRTSSTFWSAYRGPEGLIRVKTICFPKACSFNPTLSKHTIPSHIQPLHTTTTYLVKYMSLSKSSERSSTKGIKTSKLCSKGSNTMVIRYPAEGSGPCFSSWRCWRFRTSRWTATGCAHFAWRPYIGWTKRPTIDWTKKHEKNCWSKEKRGGAVKITSQGARDAPHILAERCTILVLASEKHGGFQTLPSPPMAFLSKPSPYNKPIRMNCQLQRSLEQGLLVVWDSLLVGPLQLASGTKDF